MIKKRMKRLVAILLAIFLLIGVFPINSFAADFPKMTGNQARKDNQPKFSGYRVWDIRDWTPESDPGSEYSTAKVPLQKRNEQFRDTQVNPELDNKAEIMFMSEDYGNAFVDGMMYNNSFGYYPLSFWQYTDYFSPWHGAVTATTPEDLYDPAFEGSHPRGWETRYFEFGVLNIPNPSYTNAAHKNGVKSIAVIYFDQYFRQGQTINELFVKDANGKYPVAEKLIEMAEYFGYDGYFFNAEEAVEERFREDKKLFLKTLTDAGLYTQYYDTNSNMNSSKMSYLRTDLDGDGVQERIQNSVFVNYGWPGNLNYSGMNFDFIEKNDIDPFKEVFYGVEANQGGFHGGHPTTRNITQLYEEGTNNPRASIALFSPSDYYHREIGWDKLADADYQWMVEERARLYFSGVLGDPTDTGNKPGTSRKDVFLDDTSSWVGVADFTSERTVIKGSNFYTTFNIGRGMEYFTEGKVTGKDQWGNINIQDIPLTWQWWIDASEKDNKIKMDFDFGKAETRRDINKEIIETPFEQIGAYDGGSSLVAYGDIKGKNVVNLWKTDLDVNNNSKAEITYRRNSGENVDIKLGLRFKDNAKELVELDINTDKLNEWTTSTVDLCEYNGRTIAAISLIFDGDSDDYQINFGKFAIKDNDNKPNKPEGFTVYHAYTNDEMQVGWDIESFDLVDKYEVYGRLSNGEKAFFGGIYDDVLYIKSLLEEKGLLQLELVAVGKNGEKSEPSIIEYDYSEVVNNLDYEKEEKYAVIKEEHPVRGTIIQSSEEGAINLKWDNPSKENNGYEIEVSLLANNDTESMWKQTVPKDSNSARIEIPRNKGEHFIAKVYTLFEDGSKSQATTLTGKLKDTYSDPYNPDLVSIDSYEDWYGGKETSFTFWSPESNDWFKLHAKFNDEYLMFENQFHSFGDAVPHAIRAATGMVTEATGDTGTLEVVIEDYTGNLSEPITIEFKDGVRVENPETPDEEENKEVDLSILNALIESIEAQLENFQIKLLMNLKKK